MHDNFHNTLQNYNEGDDIAPLRVLVASGKIPYQTKWLHACKGMHALKALISLFTVHARDPETHHHIFQDVVEYEWNEAIDLFLTLDPHLVNIAVVLDGAHIVPLISQAMQLKVNIDSVRKLMTDKLNVALLDYKQDTIFHDLADDKEISDIYIALLPKLISMAPADVWDIRKLDYLTQQKLTLHELWNIYPKGTIQAQPENGITKEALALRYQGLVTTPSLIDMSLSLIGKQLKYGPQHPIAITLFFAQHFLEEYLGSLVKQGKQDFFVNGILIGKNGSHAVNIMAKRENAGPISFLLIDGLAFNEFDKAGMKAALDPYSVSFYLIVINDSLQHSDTGCRIFAAYLAGRFLKPERAQQLKNMMDECIATKKYSLSLSDFPANLGPLLICQSLSKINAAVETRGQTLVNKEYPTYQEKYTRGVNWMYKPGYTDIEAFNKRQNHTLYRKNHNQLKHAQTALTVDYRSQFAKLIGASEVIPDHCQNMVTKMIENNMKWAQLYCAGSYHAKIFSAPQPGSVEHITKKQKMTNK